MNATTRNAARTARQIALFASLLGGAATLAVAHHSYSAFDMGGEKTLTGVVKKFDYTNPHSWIWLDVTNDKGSVDTWGIEGMSPNYLSRRGWSRTTLKPGDKVSITFHPAKEGNGGSFVSGKKETGETLGMTGQITNP
jgi:hypothetical protein